MADRQATVASGGRRAHEGSRPPSAPPPPASSVNLPAFDESDAAAEGGEVPGAQLQPGTYFASRYRILRLIALGGIAEVYEAWDMTRERACALKILRLQYRRAEKIRVQMAAEARALEELRHPSLVEVWDGGATEEGLLYFAMELLSGTTLHDVIHGPLAGPRPDPVPLREALRWLAELALAIHALHLAGIIHRDLKPDNVFVTRDGRIKVLDLGAAKFRCYGLKTTGAHKTIGTPPYMSPEHLRGDADIDGRSDVYSLGHVAYELIAQRHAFCAPGESHGAETYRAWQEQRRPEPLAAVRPGVPEIVSLLVLTALEKRRDDRWPSCQDLALAALGVSDYLEQEGLLDDPPPAPSSAAAAEQRIALVTTDEALKGAAPAAPAVRIRHSPDGDAPISAAPRRTARGTEIVEPSPSGARRNESPDAPAPPRTSGAQGRSDPRDVDPRRAAVAALLDRMALQREGSEAPRAAAPSAASARSTTLDVATSDTALSRNKRGAAAVLPFRRSGPRRLPPSAVLGLSTAFAIAGAVAFYLAGTRAAFTPLASSAPATSPAVSAGAPSSSGPAETALSVQARPSSTDPPDAPPATSASATSPTAAGRPPASATALSAEAPKPPAPRTRPRADKPMIPAPAPRPAPSPPAPAARPTSDRIVD